MYIKVQILLTGTIKCYWFINLDLLHLLALTLQNFQGRTWNLFGREIFFIWFIIAHIKTVRKASLVLFFTVDSICQFTAANIWQHKNNNYHGDLNFFPSVIQEPSPFYQFKSNNPYILRHHSSQYWIRRPCDFLSFRSPKSRII